MELKYEIIHFLVLIEYTRYKVENINREYYTSEISL